jgi:hypothetical protein
LRTLIAVLALATMAALALLWADRSPPGEEEPTGPAHPDAVVAQPDTAPAAATAPRHELTPSAGTAALTVRVVAADGTPVAAAEVRHSVPSAPDDAEASARLHEADRAAWAARFGVVARTDDRGVLPLAFPLPITPDSGNALYVCALHQGQFAEDWVRWTELDGAEVTLRLAPDLDLIARLVDDRDRPVRGVRLIARFVQQDLLGIRDGRRALGTTDAAGQVRAAHVQTWWHRVRADAGVRRLVVAPDIVGSTDVGTEVLLDRPLPDPVLVRMPPTGRIVVAIRGYAPGRTRWRPTVELLAAATAGETRDPGRARESADEEARVVFPWVALGRQWQARLVPSMQGHAFAGPTAPGDEVVLELAAPTVPTLVGRLVRDGAPLGDATFALSARGERMGVRAGGETDTDGRFRIELYPPELGTVLSDLQFTVTATDTPQAWSGGLARTEALTPGDNDLGDIALTSLPTLLSGRVVGDVPESLRLVCEQADPDGAFDDVRAVRQHVAADGAFALFGRVGPGALRLSVYAPAIVPVPPIPFVAGQRDLELRLPRGGSIVVDAVLGDMRGWMTLAPRVVPVDGRTLDELLALHDPSTRGIPEWDRGVPARRDVVDVDPGTLRHTWKALPPGRYRVEFRAWAVERPALEIPDVVVSEGGETRLEPVDLRDRVRYVTLRFPDLDRPGLLAERAAQGRHGFGHLFVRGAGGIGDECYSIDGSAEFLAVPGPVDVVVEVDGFLRQELIGVDADREVRLTRGLPVQLTLGAPADGTLRVTVTPDAAIALPRGARVRSRAAGGSVPTYAPAATVCRSAGETFHAEVTVPGTYHLAAELRLATGRPLPLRITPAEVTVGPDGGRAKIQVQRDG